MQTLIPTGEPQLSMEDVSIKNGENAKMTCKIFSSPPSSVIWSFIPCDKIDIDTNLCDVSRKLEYVSVSCMCKVIKSVLVYFPRNILYLFF